MRTTASLMVLLTIALGGVACHDSALEPLRAEPGASLIVASGRHVTMMIPSSVNVLRCGVSESGNGKDTQLIDLARPGERATAQRTRRQLLEPADAGDAGSGVRLVDYIRFARKTGAHLLSATCVVPDADTLSGDLRARLHQMQYPRGSALTLSNLAGLSTIRAGSASIVWNESSFIECIGAGSYTLSCDGVTCSVYALLRRPGGQASNTTIVVSSGGPGTGVGLSCANGCEIVVGTSLGCPGGVSGPIEFAFGGSGVLPCPETDSTCVRELTFFQKKLLDSALAARRLDAEFTNDSARTACGAIYVRLIELFNAVPSRIRQGTYSTQDDHTGQYNLGTGLLHIDRWIFDSTAVDFPKFAHVLLGIAMHEAAHSILDSSGQPLYHHDAGAEPADYPFPFNLTRTPTSGNQNSCTRSVVAS